MKKGVNDATLHDQDKKGRFTEKTLPYGPNPHQESPNDPYGTTVSYVDSKGKSQTKRVPHGGSFQDVFDNMASEEAGKGKK